MLENLVIMILSPAEEVVTEDTMLVSMSILGSFKDFSAQYSGKYVFITINLYR